MFLVNSRHPLACAPPRRLPDGEAPFSRSYGGNLPSSFDTVPSIASVCSTSPPVSVWVRSLLLGLFPGRPWRPPQSGKGGPRPVAVTTSGPRNVDLVPVAYGLRPRLRGRLTPRGLASRGNPRTFGGGVSHAPVATHVSIRSPEPSTGPRGPASSGTGRSATARPSARTNPRLRRPA